MIIKVKIVNQLQVMLKRFLHKGRQKRKEVQKSLREPRNDEEGQPYVRRQK